MRRVVIVAAVFLSAAFCWNRSAGGASAPQPWGSMSEVEAAAKKEGKVVIYAAPGHTSQAAERAMSQVLKEKYGLTVDWISIGAQDIAPRILTEQRTQQVVADLVMTGFPIFYSVVKPRGYVAPILAPSSMEQGIWRVDPAVMMPREREFLFITTSLLPGFFVNTGRIRSGEEPKSYKDLLDPKWQGKIVLQTPWVGGSGSGWFQATYKQLGLDYMKALAKQVSLVPNVNDVPDAVGRGVHPIGIASSTDRSRQLIREGAPVKYSHPREGSFLTTQGVYLLANPAHPNAAKLFLQWFYTREGQDIYARNTHSISLRKDVSQEHIPPDERFVEGQPLMVAEWTSDELTPEKIAQGAALAKQIFGGGQ
jgi:iron(III) transport system substrate-binding protein